MLHVPSAVFGELTFEAGPVRLYDGQIHLFKYDSNIYKGQWLQGNRHGKGVQLMASGNFYEGEWKADQANGYGRLLHKNGDLQ